MTAPITEGVVVRPGDTLIIRLAERMSAQQLHEYARVLKAEVPDLKFVIVTDTAQMLVFRPDPDPGPTCTCGVVYDNGPGFTVSTRLGRIDPACPLHGTQTTNEAKE